MKMRTVTGCMSNLTHLNLWMFAIIALRACVFHNFINPHSLAADSSNLFRFNIYFEIDLDLLPIGIQVRFGVKSIQYVFWRHGEIQIPPKQAIVSSHIIGVYVGVVVVVDGFQHAEHFPPTSSNWANFPFAPVRVTVCAVCGCGWVSVCECKPIYKRRRAILNLVISVLLNLHEYFLMSCGRGRGRTAYIRTHTHTCTCAHAQYPYLAIWQLLNFNFEICWTDGTHRNCDAITYSRH